MHTYVWGPKYSSAPIDLIDLEVTITDFKATSTDFALKRISFLDGDKKGIG